MCNLKSWQDWSIKTSLKAKANRPTKQSNLVGVGMFVKEACHVVEPNQTLDLESLVKAHLTVRRRYDHQRTELRCDRAVLAFPYLLNGRQYF